MDGKIIFISDRTEDAEFCKAVGKKLGMDVVEAVGIRGLNDALILNRQSVVFFDMDVAKTAILSVQTVVDKLSEYLNPSRLFGISDQSIFELPKLSNSSSVGNYCLRKYDAFALNCVPKLVADCFLPEQSPIESFRDAGSKEVKVTLTHSKEKEKTLLGMEKLLLSKQMNERAAQIVLQGVDELIMNAIFDAPVDDRGRPYRKVIERDALLALFDRERVEIGIILNEDTIVLHVKDHFGTFSTEKAMKLIQKDYGSVAYKTDAFTLSAGLGLRGIIGSGIGLMIHVVPQVTTHAILTFPIFSNFKSMRTSFRSFSLKIQPTLPAK
jgi:hypothetical protein